MKRVVITGAGTVNPLGLNVPDTLAAMRNGVCGIGPLDFRDVDRLSIKIGGQVHGFDGESQYNRQKIALYDRFTQFTLVAAKEAIAQAGLIFHGELAARSGVVLGTAGGGVSTWDDNYRSVYEDGKNRVHPFVVPKLMNNAAAAHLSTVDYLGDVPWKEHEEAKDWYARVKSRPSFRALLEDNVPGAPPQRHYANLDF